MKKGLIIVESPAKAKTISKFLNNQFDIKASMGHIRDLPKKEMGVEIENNFKPKYVTDRTKSKIIKELKTKAKEAPEIYLASDHDREGEAIAWHLSEVLKSEIKDKPVHRIVFNEITKKAIQNAIENPGNIDENKVDAQQARRILDRIVGYKISPLLWRVITKSLSAGRVQSVALRLICERENEIRAFKPEEYWSLSGYFYKDNLPPFKATLQKIANKKINIKNQAQAEEIYNNLKDTQFIISKITKSQRKIQPAPAYITSTLQQDAAKLLNFSAKRTMQIAQQLYEGIDLKGETVGLITYMRTDSLRISNEAIESSRKLISERFGDELLNKSIRVFKNKSSAQDAHEAIRPTDSFKTPEAIEAYLTNDQKKLYTLIWQRFIATQMIPVHLNSVTLDITGNEALFKASGNTITNKGFTLAYPHISISLGEVIDAGYVENDKVLAKQLEKKQHFTKPPSRYSEASLIKELESKGIGRPSTYATITNTIQVRSYVELKEKRFYPTPLGETVNKFLVKNFEDIINVTFTAEMEERLDNVEFGKANWIEILNHYYKAIEKDIQTINLKTAKAELIEPTDLKCEKCGSDMVIRWGKKGQFLGCSNFPECNNIQQFTRFEGKIKIKKPETISEICPKCKEGELIIRKGRFGEFISCSNYPECKYTRPITSGIKCPDCDDGEITERRSKKGKVFYSCTNYPKCKYSSWYKPVAIICPNCGNHFMEEHSSKEKGNFKQCPKCKTEVY